MAALAAAPRPQRGCAGARASGAPLARARRAARPQHAPRASLPGGAQLADAAVPVVKIALCCAVGAACGRRGLIDAPARRTLSRLGLEVFTPALLVSKLGGHVDAAQALTVLGPVGPVAVNVAAAHAAGLALGVAHTRLLPTPPWLVGVVRAATAIPNAGSLPLVIALSMAQAQPFDGAACAEVATTYVMLGWFSATLIQMPLGHLLLQAPCGDAGAALPAAGLPQPVAAASAAVPPVLAAAQVQALQRPASPPRGAPAAPTGERLAQLQQLEASWRLQPRPPTPPGRGRGQWRRRLQPLLRGLASAPALAGVAGVAVGCCPPLRAALFARGGGLAAAGDVLDMLGACLVPTMLLVLGASLSGGPGPGRVPAHTVAAVLACRCVLLPALGCGAVLCAARAGLLLGGAGPLGAAVMALEWCTPTALLVHSLASVAGAGEEEASVASLLFWEYLAAALTLPLCTAAVLHSAATDSPDDEHLRFPPRPMPAEACACRVNLHKARVPAACPSPWESLAGTSLVLPPLALVDGQLLVAAPDRPGEPPAAARLHGVNWFGWETDSASVDGLWVRRGAARAVWARRLAVFTACAELPDAQLPLLPPPPPQAYDDAEVPPASAIRWEDRAVVGANFWKRTLTNDFATVVHRLKALGADPAAGRPGGQRCARPAPAAPRQLLPARAAGFNAVRMPFNFKHLQRDLPRPAADGTEFYACVRDPLDHINLNATLDPAVAAAAPPGALAAAAPPYTGMPHPPPLRPGDRAECGLPWEVPFAPGHAAAPQYGDKLRLTMCNWYLPQGDGVQALHRFLWQLQYLVAQSPALFASNWGNLWTAITELPGYADHLRGRVFPDLVNEPSRWGCQWERDTVNSRGVKTCAAGSLLYSEAVAALHAVDAGVPVFANAMGQARVDPALWPAARYYHAAAAAAPGMAYGEGTITDRAVLAATGISDPSPFFRALPPGSAGKLALAPHVYPATLTGLGLDTQERGELFKRLDLSFGLKALGQDTLSDLTPLPRLAVVLGEFGVRDAANASASAAGGDLTSIAPLDLAFLADLADYLAGLEARGAVVSWFFWSWNANAGDTKGLVGPADSWRDVQWSKVRLLTQLYGLRPWYCRAAPGACDCGPRGCADGGAAPPAPALLPEAGSLPGAPRGAAAPPPPAADSSTAHGGAAANGTAAAPGRAAAPEASAPAVPDNGTRAAGPSAPAGGDEPEDPSWSVYIPPGAGLAEPELPSAARGELPAQAPAAAGPGAAPADDVTGGGAHGHPPAVGTKPPAAAPAPTNTTAGPGAAPAPVAERAANASEVTAEAPSAPTGLVPPPAAAPGPGATPAVNVTGGLHAHAPSAGVASPVAAPAGAAPANNTAAPGATDGQVNAIMSLVAPAHAAAPANASGDGGRPVTALAPVAEAVNASEKLAGPLAADLESMADAGAGGGGALCAELAAQLAEQLDALAGIELALAGGPDPELAEAKAELEAGAAALTAALLELESGERPQQQQDAQALEEPPAWLQPGAACRFRAHSGRWHPGVVEGWEASSGEARVRFRHPTRPHMLEALALPPALVQPPDGGGGRGGGVLAVGSRVLALPPGEQLWRAAEVTALSRAAAAAQAGAAAPGAAPEASAVANVVFVGSGRSAMLPLALILADAGDEAAELQRGEGPRGGAEQGSASDASGGSDDGGSGSESQGDDTDGGLGFARVGRGAAADSGCVMQAARLAAEAGVQQETATFAAFEAHSRGIASKLLARMGYRRGDGLGKAGRGIAEPLSVAVLPSKRGLGSAPKHKARGTGKHAGRSRGGERTRRRRAAAAAQQAAEAEGEQQQRLELATGGEGLFAFLNHSLGDGSEAADRLREAGVYGGAAAPPPATGGAAALAAAAAAASAGGGGGGPRQPRQPAPAADRQGLVSSHDDVAAAKARVEQLAAMLARNKSNKGLAPQIQRKLDEARRGLNAAAAAHKQLRRAVAGNDAAANQLAAQWPPPAPAALRAELAAQLAEQLDALAGIELALAGGPDPELAEAKAELEAGAAALTAALLELESGERPQQQQDAQALEEPPAWLQPGAACRFRAHSGRWHPGVVEGWEASSGEARVRFHHPTRPHMLQPPAAAPGSWRLRTSQ
ncbi:zinc finger CCCH domain-containing protein 18 [Scenedesmus sp. PABB004]|nr:zinc finger CCCH domain-containing protein 18 [Scenedesmus sp. PABB004]